MTEVTHHEKPQINTEIAAADSLFTGAKIKSTEGPVETVAQQNTTRGILQKIRTETKGLLEDPKEAALEIQNETLQYLNALMPHYSGWGELFGLTLNLLNQGDLAGKEETVKKLINVWVEGKKIDLGQTFNVDGLVSDAKEAYTFFNIKNKPENIDLITKLLG